MKALVYDGPGRAQLDPTTPTPDAPRRPTAVKSGDKALVSCISACGSCEYCRSTVYGQCLGGGGWILGHTTDGVQAEYARVPFATGSGSTSWTKPTMCSPTRRTATP